jgi:hypothetical protein
MAPWWIFTGSIVGLAASSLIIVYWFFRLRLAIAERGWKYTSTFVALPWIAVLFTSVYVLLTELTVIQKEGIGDVVLMYALVIFDWIALAGVSVGLILDAVRHINLQRTR